MSLAIKPSSTPSGSPSRPSVGPRHVRAIPPRPTGGPGWCWPATPSCAWPARSWRMRGCRGSGPAPSRGGHRCGSAAGSATFGPAGLAGRHAETLRALPRPTQGPGLRARRPLPSDQEGHQQAPQEGDQDRQGGLTGQPAFYTRQPPVDGQPAAPRVKSQAKSLISLREARSGLKMGLVAR